MIEFELTQALDGQPPFVFEPFELELQAGRAAAARKAAAERRRDEQRDRRDDQNRRQVIGHASDPIAQLAFELAPQFRIEGPIAVIRARSGRGGRRGRG